MRDVRNLAARALRLARRHWVWAAAAVLAVWVIAYGSPAWAAPIAAPLNQTVPRPTATPSDNPIATPTPRSDDDPGGSDDGSDDGEGSEGDSGAVTVTDPLLFLQQENTPAQEEGFFATVTVAQLNVRGGPGVDFPVVSTVPQGNQVTVLYRNEDGTWWYICCAPGMTADGWISADLVEPSFDRTQAVALLPLYGAETAPTATPATAATSGATAASANTQAAATATGPLTLTVSTTPAFAWQGQPLTLHFEVTNPHAVDVTNAEFSNELPPTLAFVEIVADGSGRTRNEVTSTGGTLVIARWARIPAGETVSATVRVTVTSDLPAGAVIDNLFAVRSANAAYTTGALSIGMPPIALPDFR